MIFTMRMNLHNVIYQKPTVKACDCHILRILRALHDIENLKEKTSIDNFDAVINPPHGAILAVGAGKKKPVVKGGDVEVATVMSVTLSVDHRVIDGALGAELLSAIKGYIEDPMTMLV